MILGGLVCGRHSEKFVNMHYLTALCNIICGILCEMF